jgi:hypothetical protein
MACVDLPTVKELMGHKHINMTLRCTQLSSDRKQRAVDTPEQFANLAHQFSQHIRLAKLTLAYSLLIFLLCRGSSVGRAED